MPHNYIHMASRLFNTPLMIYENKLDTIVQVFERKILGQDITVPVDASVYSKKKDRKNYSIHEGTALIPVLGTLVNKAGGMDAMSGLTSYEQIRTDFEDAVTDPNVKEIVLDIDSPGGEVSGVFDLADFIYSARGMKPVYASVNDMACSAAYAIASACDKIFTTRTGVTGSIGVIAAHTDISEMEKQKGIKITTVFAGKNKNLFSPHQPLSEDAKNTLQSEINSIYSIFIETVARNRGLSSEHLKNTEASVYMGDKGIEARLADGIGTLDQLVASVQRNRNGASASAPVIEEKAMTTTEDPKPAAQSNVIDFATAREEGKTQALGEVNEIVSLCQIAGKPALAAEFISKKFSITQVREELIKRQTVADEVSSVREVSADFYSSPDNPVIAAATKIRDRMLAQAKQAANN